MRCVTSGALILGEYLRYQKKKKNPLIWGMNFENQPYPVF